MRSTNTHLLALLFACVLGLSACSDQHSPPSSLANVTKTTPEEKFAARLKAAEEGDTVAQFDLAGMYDKGEGVPKDAFNAAKWCRRAAENGHARAQNNLGTMYATGDGVPKDESLAVEWYRKAAEQGDALAQFNLSGMYYKGKGVPKDASVAVEWCRKAADQGHVRAQNILAMLYQNGDGTAKDASKAVEWYRKAADQGDAESQISLGMMYLTGEGVPQDAFKAVEWYRKAAEQGNADGQGFLGLMYYSGEGVPEDFVLAYAWLNLAAAQGNEKLIQDRNQLATRISKLELQEAQRISSNWMPGTTLVREGKMAVASKQKPDSSALSKKETGTAFVVGKDGYAITNYHTTQGCTELRIGGHDGIAKLVTGDKINDLALLQIPDGIRATAPISETPTKLRQGEDIVVFGFPLNVLLSSGGNLTPGMVSALSGMGNNTNQIQITAPIQPGSSGSAVLNKKGEVVGVVSMKLSDSKMAKATGSVGQNVNFAVSGQTLKTFLDTHKVNYRTGGLFTFEKSAADLADEARKWTLLLECWK